MFLDEPGQFIFALRVRIDRRIREDCLDFRWVLPEEWRDDSGEDEAFAESLRRSRREAFAALEQLN